MTFPISIPIGYFTKYAFNNKLLQVSEVTPLNLQQT